MIVLTIDKGNNLDQNMTKKAADMLRLQLNEQSTPAADKYALRRFVTMAGTIATAASAPTKDNIVDLISTGAQVLDDNLVPDGDRYVYVSSEIYKMIRLSPEFTGLEGLGVKAVAKGICGEISGLSIVRVPKSYMPEGCYFLITHKNAVLMPYKISDAKVHNDPVGVSGALIEGRHYYDAFVLGAKAAGVYALVEAGKQLEAPQISEAAGRVTLTQTNATEIRYTVDGTDPRYSDSARIYSGSFAAEAAEVKAVAFAETLFPSAVAVGE
ncbi:MAG: chitobiase/beta-hexosaminidase C-terminal domain-containing protein [Eubacteriales bacterium]|nr:chitobiase/beta-hexosaminidase C-terminal domain-containing protein [Eubacteriales bacterium]